MGNIPKRYERLKTDYPKIFEAYENLGSAVHSAGSLDDKTRALIKLGISASARSEGAVHSHTRKSLVLGLSKDEIRQAVLLALPTIGLPSTMAALSWVDDILDS